MGATYIVTAPLVIAELGEGGNQYVYQGAPVPEGQSDEWIERHLDGNMIARVADDPSGKPAGNASVEEWRAYAVAQGMDADEADSQSRDELRAQLK